jgi:hypothetical protein
VIGPTQGLYLHTGQQNTEKRRHTSIPRAGFEPAISTSERLKTVLASDRSTIETGCRYTHGVFWSCFHSPLQAKSCHCTGSFLSWNDPLTTKIMTAVWVLLTLTCNYLNAILVTNSLSSSRRFLYSSAYSKKEILYGSAPSYRAGPDTNTASERS